MKRTPIYQLGYFEEQDLTDSVVEMQRWVTLDVQLYALFNVLGNGVKEGWNILPSSGLNVTITPGSGHVVFIAVQSTESVTLTLTPSIRNYIYVVLNQTSYWDQSVSFVARASESDELGLYLGYVDTDATQIIDVNTDGRVLLGFITLIQNFIAAHRHIGGDNNPPPVNLSSEVQGIINQRNLPDMDASIIKTGTIDDDRLPAIDHITKLINQGTLTHAQLDSFVEALNIADPTLMGETSTIDLLQLILALKHVYPDIDEYMVNEIAFIPGISPDNYVDWDNTTATVDINTYSESGGHTITGHAAPSKRAYTKTWDTEAEFGSGTNQDVYINGDTVCLDTEENVLVIDQFADITGWSVLTTDLSSVPSSLTLDPTTWVFPIYSGKLSIGNTQVEVALLIKKEFDAQDWSNYNYIVFYLKTTNVEHGDIFFFLNDNIAGVQNSYTKVLDRNTPTINIDTLQNGWQQITVDISAYTRSEINVIGFYISTQAGWDTSKGFDLNIDDIYLTTGNQYKEDGYMRVIYGNNTFPYEYWRVRWDATIPTDLPHSTGIVFKSRTRVANTQAALNTAVWSAYSSTSGYTVNLPLGALYKFIEIEMYFGASTDLSRTATLRKLFLDYYASDVENSFTYNEEDDWESGSRFNVDIKTVPNAITVSGINELGDIYYGTDKHAKQIDSNLVELYNITGSVLPITTNQVLSTTSPSLGLVTGIQRGDNGNMWLSDVDNDRIVELDKSGALIRGFYGTFLSEPIDTYGTEEMGPGSNVNVIANTASSTISTSIDVLHSLYNPNSGILYIVFNADVENIYASDTTFDINKIYLKIGTQRFYLNDSTVELLGVGEEAYNNWVSLTTSADTSGSAKFINQFAFTSHALKITLNGADKTALNEMVDATEPSIVILDPNEQKRTGSSVTAKFILYNFELGTALSGNRIRVTLDGSSVQDIISTEVSYSGLAVGTHTIKAQLVDSDGSLNTNIEAIAEGSFIVYSGTMTAPYISITTPKPNQIYSSSPVTIEFKVENFPILSLGQHLRYVLDSEPAVDYYSTNPIVLEDVDAGEHTIRLYLVDERGNDLGYTYGSVTGDFIVGLNSNALVRLYVDRAAISNLAKTAFVDYSRTNTDVSNVYFANIYAPVDIQMLPADTSAVNPNGTPSVLVAKLRSRSWTDGLAGIINTIEMTNRITAEVRALASQVNSSISSSVTSTTASNLQSLSSAIESSNDSAMQFLFGSIASSFLSDIETPALIYGTNYLNGHSVVQLNMTADTLFTNNAAKFASTRETAKSLLGSVEKIGDDEILIADSFNKRAIIVYTNLDTGKPLIEFEYNSDRYVPDAHIIYQEAVTIEINDDSISPSEIFIRQGTTIIWENNSSKPVSIYSGTTTYDLFQLDPDLNLYGDLFSQTIAVGDRFSYKFISGGEINYFIYPDILTGSVNVTKNRISNRDEFLLLESDNLESPFSSRLIRVDCYGNILWSFGEGGYLVKPRDVRPSFNDNLIIST